MASSKDRFSKLITFLQQNETTDLRKINLNSADQINALNWEGLTRSKRKILEQLKAYQRLTNIVPNHDQTLILDLLREDLHSALVIAAIPKKRFLAKYAHLTEDKALLEACYQNALALRAKLMINYVNLVQEREQSIF